MATGCGVGSAHWLHGTESGLKVWHKLCRVAWHTTIGSGTGSGHGVGKAWQLRPHGMGNGTRVWCRAHKESWHGEQPRGVA